MSGQPAENMDVTLQNADMGSDRAVLDRGLSRHNHSTLFS